MKTEHIQTLLVVLFGNCMLFVVSQKAFLVSVILSFLIGVLLESSSYGSSIGRKMARDMENLSFQAALSLVIWLFFMVFKYLGLFTFVCCLLNISFLVQSLKSPPERRNSVVSKVDSYSQSEFIQTLENEKINIIAPTSDEIIKRVERSNPTIVVYSRPIITKKQELYNQWRPSKKVLEISPICDASLYCSVSEAQKNDFLNQSFIPKLKGTKRNRDDAFDIPHDFKSLSEHVGFQSSLFYLYGSLFSLMS